ncbi:MAG: hypothetical protein M3Z25_07075 [Actinomycetota bacterium]|nr:hypothetical protein [Actinomycetota bacterium]
MHWIANQGHIEELINAHVRTATGQCGECGKSWPCNWRRLADEALDLLDPAAWRPHRRPVDP